jgi:hypothetical protein
MSKLIFKIAPAMAISACLMLSACASINSVSLTSIPAKKNNEVRALTSKVIVLGLNFDNDYVNAMVDDLKRQCPDGQVKGILTKDEVINYFLFIVYKRQVSATGYCQKRGSVAMNEGNNEIQ